MAYGGLQAVELLCPVCKTFIETNNDLDLQTYLDFHFTNMHPTLRDTFRANNQAQLSQDIRYKIKNAYQEINECSNYLICPVCENTVGIFQNNINHCFMEHFDIFHESTSKLGVEDKTLYTPNKKIEQSDILSGNSGKNDVLPDLQVQLNCPLDLPSDLEQHSGYITQQNNSFVCKICKETSNTQLDVEKHLKTKRHEDNVINLLKCKLSSHMQSEMEFVSLYGSNLCCNLCRCKIDLNSKNPHETLLKVISHNTDSRHSKAKSKRNTIQSNVTNTMLKSLTENNSIINEHKDCIETEMVPRFKCTLCDDIINFSKNEVELEFNFMSHIKSVLHTKNFKAMIVLQYFREIKDDKEEKHSFVVSNGFINCVHCKCNITPSIEQLLEHSQTSANVKSSQSFQTKAKECAPVSPDKPITPEKKKSFSGKNPVVTELTSKISSATQLNSSQAVRKVSQTKEVRKSQIKEILKPLTKQFGNITCIAETENGDLTCVICNCSIQPTTHCVKMHMQGKFHKNKIQCQIKELKTMNTNDGITLEELNLNEEETAGESYQKLIDQLFQSVPQKFQEEKDFFTINLTDGSVNCLLCDCIIDPLLMEVHLRGEVHLNKKQLKQA